MVSHATCTGCEPSGESPSMVVIGLPTTVDTCVKQDRTAWPATITVQAPHRPMPQPYLVPCRLRVSRSTQRSGVSGSTSTVLTTLLIFSSTGIGELRFRSDIAEIVNPEGLVTPTE